MTTCIPYARGVPGRSAPPNWWDESIPPTSPSLIDTRLEDPRWRGAYGQGFGSGTVEETMFRALFHTTGGSSSLYLSWHVKYDAASSPTQDMIYVGFAAGAAAQPLILQIVIYAADVDKQAQPAASITAGTRNAAGRFEALADEPDWIAQTTRVWRNTTLGQWAVQMKVPMTPGAALGADAGVDLNPAGTFRLWYCYDIYTPTNAGGGEVAGGILRLPWPTAAGFTVSAGQKVYPAPAAYEEYQLGTTGEPSCAGGDGISLTYLNVGTTNTPASAIDINNPNTLFARPTNQTGVNVAAQQIKARFAIANWGSIADPHAPWTTIRSNEGNSGVIANGATADVSNDIRFSWSVPADMADEFRNGTKSRHQCMLVELSGAGLTFANTSVYRNMDFVGNSKFSREAEISVVGLSPISLRPRDVYLAVETRNMPAKIDPGPEKQRLASLNQTIAVGEQGGLLDRITDYVNSYRYDTEQGETPYLLQQSLEEMLPIYRVHCYSDTGQREVINGRNYVILALQSNFGYYAVHEGSLEGWSHRLRGAIRLAENFYVLRVPNNGVAKITTMIQAVEPGEAVEPDVPIQPWPEPSSEPSGRRPPWWLIILLLILLLLLILWIF